MRRFTKGTRWGAGAASLALIAATLTAGGGGALAASADESTKPNTPNAQSGAETTNSNTDPQIDTTNTNTGNTDTSEGTGSGSSGGGGVSPLAGEIPGLDVSIKITSAGSDTCIDPETPADDASCNEIAPDGMSATVPVNDEVVFEVQVVNNHEDMSDAAITLVLPKGMYMTSIPGSCDATTSSLTPTDPFANVTWPITQTVNEDQVQQQTLVCALPKDGSGIAVATGFSGGYFFPAKLGNLVPNNHAYDLEEVTFGGTTTSSTSVDVTLENLPEITAASMLKWSLSKNGAAAVPNTSTAYINPVRCPWTEDDGSTRPCRVIGYPVTISAPANGLGAMPAIGDATWTDDLSPASLFPNLDATALAAINADLPKYGARLALSNNFGQLLPGIGIGLGGGRADNAVRYSGLYVGAPLFAQVPTSAAGVTSVPVTLQGTDWSLATYPTQNSSNQALPAIGGAVPAYAVANTMNLYIPADTIVDFGVKGNNTWSLRTTNRFPDDLHLEGFADAVTGITAVQDGNYAMQDWLYRTTSPVVELAGSMNKYFHGVPGTVGNVAPSAFTPSSLAYEGLPGGGTSRQGNSTVSPGQPLISGLFINGPTYGQAPLSALVCDGWDNSKLQLRAANIPASTRGASLQKIPSGGTVQGSV